MQGVAAQENGQEAVREQTALRGNCSYIHAVVRLR